MNPRSCLLLLLFFLVPAAPDTPTCSTDACKTDCENCSDNGFMADPEDCHYYYICDGEGNLKYPQSFKCPDGQVFNANDHSCSDTTPCQVCSRCFYDCVTSTSGMISSPDDCKVYAECNNGVPGFTQSCSSSMPYFDGFKCQEDETRCCNCHAYCYPEEVDTLIADPKDCRNYYLCDSPGEATTSGTCPSDQYFDASLHDCSPYTSCNTLCKNMVGNDGCIALYTCVEKGYFPKCPSLCKREYYHCTEISDTYIEPDSCPIGYVFHPDNHVCVTKNHCP